MSNFTMMIGKFRFRIPRKLGHFSNDYDPSNPMHTVIVELATPSATTKIKEVGDSCTRCTKTMFTISLLTFLCPNHVVAGHSTSCEGVRFMS